ncbi:MAG: NUDIX hydrolase [bacterium]|nr:NUDIX hydrolase [bacterium]
MRLAATVMLVRDARPGRLEVFMLRRSARSSFAPDAFVFPGGTVDPGDYAGDLGWPPERVAAEFRAVVPEQLPASEPPIGAEDARALVRAAVREVFEESNLRLDADALALYSHWITPPTEPRRYNTHFFIARAPSEQHGIADAVETHDERWIEPATALREHEAGRMHLVYPTIKHLERLALHGSVADALAFARSKPVVTIMPDRAPSEGFVMPNELEGAW